MGNKVEDTEEQAIVIYGILRCPTVSIVMQAVGQRVESPPYATRSNVGLQGLFAEVNMVLIERNADEDDQ